MYRKITIILLSIALLTCLACPAMAAEQTGSIRITLAGQVGEVALYLAGKPVSEGYRLEDAFGGGFVKEEDVYSTALAQWLAESADSGRNRILDADGSAEFSGLEEGLYLLVQTEEDPEAAAVQPFLIPIPCVGQWHVEANPKTGSQDAPIPKTGQPIQPFLGAAGMVLSTAGLLLCSRKRYK